MSLRYFDNELLWRPKYSYCIFLKGLCWVSVCWILNNALHSMSWAFYGFYFVPHCAINIWRHILCYLPNIYNYITFKASLERVQFEFVQSVMPVDTKKTVVLIFFIGSLNVQYMNFPKKRKDKKKGN